MPVLLDARLDWKLACAALYRADLVVARLIDRYPGEALEPHGDVFRTLLRSIVGQQISVAAAERIWARMIARLGTPTPRAVLAAGEAALVACGLTRRKAAHAGAIALLIRDAAVDTGAWRHADDEAVAAALQALPGIGRWSADMVMIFALGRPDVLPAADIGLQRAVARHFGIARSELDKARLEAVADRWRPWRSVATWYLWRDLDPVPVAY